MNEPKQTAWYADKAFLSVILVPILALVSKKLGVPLNTEEIIAFAATVIGFITAAKWKGATMAKADAARVEAEAKFITAEGTERRMELAEKALTAALMDPKSGIKVDMQ
jgi:hypothetical protein